MASPATCCGGCAGSGRAGRSGRARPTGSPVVSAGAGVVVSIMLVLSYRSSAAVLAYRCHGVAVSVVVSSSAVLASVMLPARRHCSGPAGAPRATAAAVMNEIVVRIWNVLLLTAFKSDRRCSRHCRCAQQADRGRAARTQPIRFQIRSRDLRSCLAALGLRANAASRVRMLGRCAASAAAARSQLSIECACFLLLEAVARSRSGAAAADPINIGPRQSRSLQQSRRSGRSDPKRKRPDRRAIRAPCVTIARQPPWMCRGERPQSLAAPRTRPKGQSFGQAAD